MHLGTQRGPKYRKSEQAILCKVGYHFCEYRHAPSKVFLRHFTHVLYSIVEMFKISLSNQTMLKTTVEKVTEPVFASFPL